METGARIAAVLLIAVGLATLLAYFVQRTFIYYPSRANFERLAPLAEREHLFPWRNAKGDFIGWHNNGGGGTPILIFHGNAGHALHRANIVARLSGTGIGSPFYILEYPGYGARQGSPSEPNLVNAAIEALDLLGQEVILLGESLGTGVACAVASARPDAVRGLILLTPFDSLITVAGKHYPLMPIRLILRDRYESSRALQRFKGPLAIIMAENDDVIPSISTTKLFEAYSGPKKLWRIPGSGHNQVLADSTDFDLRAAYEFANGG